VIRKEIKSAFVSPPLRLSPPAGQLVCSLLRQDVAGRLGSRADADVKKAAFFHPVDWAALAVGTAPPAFDVGNVAALTAADRASALQVSRMPAPCPHAQQPLSLDVADALAPFALVARVPGLS
jgi:hypothetical protein